MMESRHCQLDGTMTALWLNKALNEKYPTKNPVNIVTATCRPVKAQDISVSKWCEVLVTVQQTLNVLMQITALITNLSEQPLT